MTFRFQEQVPSIKEGKGYGHVGRSSEMCRLLEGICIFVENVNSS